MKLGINCQRCKQLVPFSANVSDRFELANVYTLAGFAGIIIAPYWMYEAIVTSHREKVRYFNRKNYG